MEFTVLEYCETQHFHDDMDLKLCKFCCKAMCQTCFDIHKIHCSGQTESHKRQFNNSTYSQGQPQMKKSRNTDVLRQNEKFKHSSSTTPQLPLENDTRDAYPGCKVHLLSEDRFCLTHCILVCQTCQTEHHASCTVKLVTEICDRLDHTAVTEYKKWLNKLRVSAIQIQTLLDKNLESEEKQKITSLSNLQSIFSKANENLNHAFLDAKSDIEKIFECDSSENWKKVSQLKDVKDNLESSLKDIRPLEGSKMEVSLFVKLVNFISKYNNKAMPAELKNISENLRKVKYSFVPNNRYQPLSSQSRSYLARVNTNSTKLTLVNTAFTEDLSQMFSKHINDGITFIRTMPEKYSLRNAHDLQTRLKTAESVYSITETQKSDNSLRKDFTAKATGQYALGFLNDRQNNQMDNESFAKEKHFELIQTGNCSDEKRDMLPKTFLTERRNKKKAEESRTRQPQPSTTLVNIQASTKENDHTGLFPSGSLVFAPYKPATAIAHKTSVSLTDGTSVKESHLADCSANSCDYDSASNKESMLITRKQLSASEKTDNDTCNHHKLKDSGESGVRIGQNTENIFTDTCTGDAQKALAFGEPIENAISNEVEPCVSKFQTNEHNNSESVQSPDTIHVVEISGLSNITTKSNTCNDAVNFARSESITVPLFRQNEGQNYAAGATASLCKQSSQYITYTNTNHDMICKQQHNYTTHDKQTLQNFRNIVHPFHSKNRDAGEIPSHAQSKSYRIPFSSDVEDNCFAKDLSQKTYRSNNDCDTTKHCDSTPSERIYSADIVGNDHRQQFSMLSNKTADYFKGNHSSHNDFYRLPLDVDIRRGNNNDATRLNNNLGNTSHLPDSPTSHMHVAINTKASTIMGDTTEMQRNKRVMFTGQTIKHVKQICIKQPSDKWEPYINGCDFLPDGRVILCDKENQNVKLLDKSFTVHESLGLPSSPWDISVVSDTTAIITLPVENQLQYIEVTPRLKLGRTIQLDKACFGVQVIDSDIYVTCRSVSPCYDGEVRILDKYGNLKKRLGVNRDETFMFSAPNYLTVSERTNRIYVSDWDRDTVTCMKPDGTVIFQYEDPELLCPAGLCVDDEDNVIVCGTFSHNIHIVTAAGEKSSVILTKNDGIQYLLSVAYRRKDHTVIVGCPDNDNLFVISFAEK